MKTPTPQPNYRSSIWEAIAITLGALALVCAGLAGLGLKAYKNAFEPQRAEAIAQSIIDYQLPGESQGIFGIHIGGLKIAQVNSYEKGTPDDLIPQVELIIARVLLDNKNTDFDPQESLDPSENPLTFPYYQEDEFQSDTEITQTKLLCGQSVPVTIQNGTLIITEDTENTTIAAIRYTARIIFSDHQYLVKITATAPDAESKADSVFKSLQCQ